MVLLAALIVTACGRSAPRTFPFDTPENADDARLRAELEQRLSAEPSLSDRQIRVEARAGTVALHGIVYGMGEWQCALTNAELTPGVQRVVDYMVLGRGPQQVRCLAPRPPLASG